PRHPPQPPPRRPEARSTRWLPASCEDARPAGPASTAAIVTFVVRRAGTLPCAMRLRLLPSAAVALVIAHRGASGTRPENTLASFRHAQALGAHMVELDVQLSRDGAVVVIHDWTLRRTTGVRGRV